MEQIAVITADQIREIATEAARAALAGQPTTDTTAGKPRRYVYGLRGIRDLFNVSHTTAQRYKNTFLAPAITQRGKKIVVDADRAMELFNAHQTAQ